MLHVVPWKPGKPVTANQNRNVTGQHKAVPVDHRINGHRCAEPGCATDYPTRQHPASAATGNEKIVRIYVSEPGDCSIDPRIQIVEVIARILIVDKIAEFLAIARAATRVHV